MGALRDAELTPKEWLEIEVYVPNLVAERGWQNGHFWESKRHFGKINGSLGDQMGDMTIL